MTGWLGRIVAAAGASAVTLGGAAFAGALPASAANPQLVVNVTTTADGANSTTNNAACTSGALGCTLRAAVQYADTKAGAATPSDVTINVPPGNYVLSIPCSILDPDDARCGDLHLGGGGVGKGAVTLTGAGPSRTFITQTPTLAVVDQNPLVFAERAIKIDPSSGVEISGVTVRGGTAAHSAGDIQNDGGGIQVCGGSFLLLHDAIITGNRAQTDLTLDPTVALAPGSGGGISVLPAGTCQVTLPGLPVLGLSSARATIHPRGTAMSPAAASSLLGAASHVAVENPGLAVIERTVINGNSAEELGGGVYNGGLMLIRDSTLTADTVTGNVLNPFSLPEGGAVHNAGNLILINDTITKNSSVTSGNGGGGIYAEGIAQSANPTTTELENVTLANNTSGPGQGGGIRIGIAAATVFTVRSSIVAGNLGGNCVVDRPNSIIDQKYNLESANECGFQAGNGSIVNTDPQLGALGVSFGTTPTLDPKKGSPAIDGVGTDHCPHSNGLLSFGNLVADQRGIPRPQGARCDIGAVEVIQTSLTSIDPACLPLTGGAVAITGSGFTHARGVTFGGNPATSFTVNSDTSITAVAPPGSGAVDVVVQGLDTSSSAGRLTYGCGTTPTNLPNTASATPIAPTALGPWLLLTIAGAAALRRRRRARE